MDEKIQLVKMNFNKIKDIRNQVIFCFNALENKLTKLKTTTNEFVKNNKNNIYENFQRIIKSKTHRTNL